jgi:hypothetical protein
VDIKGIPEGVVETESFDRFFIGHILQGLNDKQAHYRLKIFSRSASII